MSSLGEKLGYIRGVMDGLKLDREDDTVKLLGMIVDALGDVSASITQLENDQQELNDYVESIDDDLTDLEQRHGGPFRDSEDDDDEDDYDITDDEVPNRREKGRLSVLHGNDEEEEDEDEIEEAETEFYIGCVCPECGRFFSVKNPDDYEDDQKFECPFCKKHVVIAPMDLESIPTALPVED